MSTVGPVPLALFAAALLAVACGGGSNEAPPPSVAAATADAASLHVRLDPASRALFEQSSPFQQALVEDGLLTFPEYERALVGLVSCMQARGFSPAEEPCPDALFAYHLVFQYGPGQLEAGQEAHRHCYREYLREIAMAWAGVLPPNAERLLADARAHWLACYRERTGRADVDYPALTEATHAGVDDALQCLRETQGAFNLPRWGG